MAILKSLRKWLALLACCAVSVSCGDAESLYSSFYAYFSYTPVNSKPTLYRACTSLGEFCSITFPVGSKKYVIQSPSTPSETDYIDRTSDQGYRNFRLGLGTGLIIGLPSIPEMMATESTVVCYDLCCPSCYQNEHVQKGLTLSTRGTASCSMCQRVYDLNAQGIITSGEAGRALYRYYISYSPTTFSLTVNNR